MTRTIQPDSASLKGEATQGRSGFVRAVGWTFVMDSGAQVITLGISLALAAMLGPRTYGVVAMATVYIAFLQMVQRQGMGAAIIQRKDLTGKHLDTAFWLTLGSSGVLMGASLGLAGWWAAVNDLPELQPIISALSVLVLIEALTTVQMALLMRRMKFRALAARTVIGASAGGVIGLTGAALGWGAWAIVAQQLTTATVSLIVLWAVSEWRPSFRFSKSAARHLFGFSTGSFLSSVAVFANNRADVLLVGLFFGPVVVGVYHLVSRLIDTLVSLASRPVQTLALPELSPHQDDPNGFAWRLRRLTMVSAVLGLPALGILAGGATPLINLLGSGWDGAATVLQILCVVGLVRIVVVIDGPLLQALGRPFIQAGVTWFAAAISVGTFTSAGILLQDSPEDQQALLVAVSRATIYGLLIAAIHIFVIRRYTSIPVLSLSSVYSGPLFAGLLAALTGIVVANSLDTATPIVALLVTGLASTMTAALMIVILQRDIRSTVMPMVFGRISRRGQRQRHTTHDGRESSAEDPPPATQRTSRKRYKKRRRRGKKQGKHKKRRPHERKTPPAAIDAPAHVQVSSVPYKANLTAGQETNGHTRTPVA